MILVAGATGFLGRDVCRRLAEQGRVARGLVRRTSDPETVAQLQAWGVETVEADLKDSDSLRRACAGAELVISTVTTTRSRQERDSVEMTDYQGQLDLVDAAAGAGVERFIYISYSGQIGGDDPLTRAKRGVEGHLRASGMTYTILRPSCFMEVWLSPALGFDHPNASATIFGSGENRLSWISIADVAAFTVQAVDNPAARNAVLELGGPQALSPNEVVKIFEEVSGRPFRVDHVPEDALRAQRAAATNSMDASFAALMLAVAAGDEIPMEHTLRSFPLRLRSVREYASAVSGPRPVAQVPN